MAVAPINKVLEVVLYALTRIDPSKIYLGIPTYGYDWTLPYVKGASRAKLISSVDAVDIARKYGVDILYDEVAQSPHFNYFDEQGREHAVWFEDAKSIQAKMNLIKDYELIGAGYWNLMREFPQNWQVLNANFQIQQ